VAQRVGRGIALLFHDRGHWKGVSGQQHAPPHFTPGKDPVPIVQVGGWAPGPVWTGGKSHPHQEFFLNIYCTFKHMLRNFIIISASCFGSSFPIPCPLILILAEPHSGGEGGWGGVSLPAPCPIQTTVSPFLGFSHLL